MMKKLLSLTILAVSCIVSAKAQFNYNLTVNNQTYTPLTSGTSINGSTVWDDESYKIPLGFSFKMNGMTIDSLSIVEGNLMATDTTVLTSGFLAVGSDLYDRGNAGSLMSESPISYEVTGVTPNRIFKVEFSNAGFYEEFDNYTTNFDSLNYQVWLYETSDIFEIHYGSSSISHDTAYFPPVGKPQVGFFKNIDLNNNSLDMFYYLKGNPNSPTLDSTNNLLTHGDGLNSFPADGTVYRFAPKTSGITELHSINLSVYPTVFKNDLIIENKENEIIQFRVIAINGAETGVSGTVLNGKYLIDMSALPTGGFLLHLEGKNKTKRLLIFKQ